MINVTIHFTNGDRQDMEFPNRQFAKGYLRALGVHQLITQAEWQRLIGLVFDK